MKQLLQTQLLQLQMLWKDLAWKVAYKEHLKFGSLKPIVQNVYLFICNKMLKKPMARKRVKDSTIREFFKGCASMQNTLSSNLENFQLLRWFIVKNKNGSCRENNKISLAPENDVEHIKKYPKYKLYNCREKMNGSEYHSSNTILGVMHNMYEEELCASSCSPKPTDKHSAITTRFWNSLR